MRLFVAIELSNAVRSALKAAQAALRSKCDGVRWVPPEQLHLTVKFLGEVADGDVPGVCGAIQRAAAGEWSMEVAECGCFPERGPVRIVWVSVREASGRLAVCVEAAERELEALGFPREARAFSPHITIGRVREDCSRGAVRGAVEAFRLAVVEQDVSSLTLMSSVLSAKGPTYSVVSRANLGA